MKEGPEKGRRTWGFGKERKSPREQRCFLNTLYTDKERESEREEELIHRLGAVIKGGEREREGEIESETEALGSRQSRKDL